MRTQAHYTAERNSSVTLLAFVAVLVLGLGWALYTGARQVESLVRCEQLAANVEPADDCPQPVGSVTP